MSTSRSSTVMDIEFECCGAVYSTPIALGEGQLLLRQPGLGDTLIAMAEQRHTDEHPECGEVITPPREVPWMERGVVRYALGSYGLWARHIFYDLIGRKPKKRRFQEK